MAALEVNLKRYSSTLDRVIAEQQSRAAKQGKARLGVVTDDDLQNVTAMFEQAREGKA